MIAIIAATNHELKYFLQYTGIQELKTVNGVQIAELTFSGKAFIVAISGVGIKRARAAADLLAGKYDLSLIISAGFCGSLKQQLTPGDAVIPSWVEKADSENGKYILYNDIFRNGSCKSNGGVISSNRFINSSIHKKLLAGKTHTSCVDMETWSVASCAERRGIPVAGLRVITDGFHTDLPDMQKIYTREQRLSRTRSFKYFSMNPKLLLPFLKFYYFDLDRASRSLNESLLSMINELPEGF